MRNLLLLTSFVLFLAACHTGPEKTSQPESVRYEQLDSRSPSDVAMVAMPALDGGAPESSKLIIGEQLVWIDGKVYEDWKVELLRSQPLGKQDPIFADVYWQMDSATCRTVRYSSGDKVIGIVHEVGTQLALIAEPAGAPVHVFERELVEADARALEAGLLAAGYQPGNHLDGVIDAETRAALGHYLQAQGLHYRPLRPAISDAVIVRLASHSPAGSAP